MFRTAAYGRGRDWGYVSPAVGTKLVSRFLARPTIVLPVTLEEMTPRPSEAGMKVSEEEMNALLGYKVEHRYVTVLPDGSLEVGLDDSEGLYDDSPTVSSAQGTPAQDVPESGTGLAVEDVMPVRDAGHNM
jgi:hypothetical protein